MVRVILGGGPAAGAGQALDTARQVREEGREAERREQEYQRNLRLADLQVQAAEQQAADLSDPTSYVRQSQKNELEAQRAGIDRENALAARYRNGQGPGGRGVGQAQAAQGNGLAAFDPNDPLVRFLGRSQGPQAVEALSRLELKDRQKYIEDVVRPGFEREDVQKRAGRLMNLEANYAPVALEMGFPGTEALLAQYEAGGLSHQEFVMAHEDLRIGIEQNAEVVAYGQQQMAIMDSMLGDGASVAGSGSKQGARALALSARMRVLMEDPTPDEEEIREVVAEFHYETAHPSVKKMLDTSQAEALEYQGLLNDLSARSQGPLANAPRFDPEAPQGTPGEPENVVDLTASGQRASLAGDAPPVELSNLNPELVPEVAGPLLEWLQDPSLDDLSAGEFRDALAARAKEIGVEGTPEEIEEMLKTFGSSQPEPLPENLDFSAEPDPYQNLGL